MISALFDLISAIAKAFFQVFGALVHIFVELLSGISQAVLWPFRAASALLFGDWHTMGHWTPLYFATCLLILLALAALIGYGYWKRRTKQ